MSEFFHSSCDNHTLVESLLSLINEHQKKFLIRELGSLLSPIDAWILEGGFEFLKHKVYQNIHLELTNFAEFLLVGLHIKIREVFRVDNDFTNCSEFLVIIELF